MITFPSVHSYQSFAKSVLTRRRYFRDSTQEAFLAAVIATSGSRREKIPGGSPIFRAQLGCDWPETEEEEQQNAGPRPFPPKRMLPLRDRAREGRANPRGISCLYAATNEKTAAAEVRPWKGTHVSVAKLRVLRDLQLVNCTTDDQRHLIYIGGEPEPAERELAVWLAIDRAFAHPVDLNSEMADYAPTQIIAEAFHEHGLDGIAYRSSLGPGHNLALFDEGAVNVISCTVHQVRDLNFEFVEACDRRFFPERCRSESM